MLKAPSKSQVKVAAIERRRALRRTASAVSLLHDSPYLLHASFVVTRLLSGLLLPSKEHALGGLTAQLPKTRCAHKMAGAVHNIRPQEFAGSRESRSAAKRRGNVYWSCRLPPALLPAGMSVLFHFTVPNFAVIRLRNDTKQCCWS